MKIFLRKHGRAVAYITLTLAIALSLAIVTRHAALQLYDSQLASCHRSNGLRVESNARIASHEADTQVLRSFLSAAHAVRLTAAKQLGPIKGKNDLQAAREYAHLIRVLDARVKFNRVPLVNCDVAIKKPT